MTNILTATEASNVLRCAVTDPLMLDLLPAIDKYIENATGRDWSADTTIRPEAKSAARILLVRAHEDPGALAQPAPGMGWGLSACLVQLEALALELETAGVPDEALALMASAPPQGYAELSVTANLVLVFNHAMAGGATSCVTLEDAAGSLVTVVNSLDVTSTILTINPTGSLAADSTYTLAITAAPDIYGQTLTTEIGFRTA